MAEFIKKINEQMPPEQDENKTKLMYSCARKVKGDHNPLQDLAGLLIFGAICMFVVYRLGTRTPKNSSAKSGLLDFTKNHEIGKLLIGLMLLTNVKNLSTSLVNNIILPIIEPILPFLLCGLRIKYGDKYIQLGEVISDLLVFTINLVIIYFLYLMIM